MKKRNMVELEVNGEKLEFPEIKPMSRAGKIAQNVLYYGAKGSCVLGCVVFALYIVFLLYAG